MSNLRQMCPHAACAIWPRPIDSLLSLRATGSQVSLMDNSHMLKNDNFITMSVISPPQLILPALQHDSVTVGLLILLESEFYSITSWFYRQDFLSPNQNSVSLHKFYAWEQLKIRIPSAIYFGVSTWLALVCVIAWIFFLRQSCLNNTMTDFCFYSSLMSFFILSAPHQGGSVASLLF